MQNANNEPTIANSKTLPAWVAAFVAKNQLAPPSKREALRIMNKSNNQ